MKVILTTHVATNLYFRGIDGWKAIEVVKSSSWKKTQEDGNIIVRKDFEGKVLEVVYLDYPDRKVIKTAYYVD